MFHGYTDDSGSTESGLLTLSCLIGWGGEWFWFENLWLNCLEKMNKQLRGQGRKELSRYHASDCSCRLGEFADWTTDEQRQLTQQLLAIFSRHPLVVISYTVDLNDIVAEIPESHENPKGIAHVILLTNLMVKIGERVFDNKRFDYSKDCIALVHDRGDVDAILLEAFHHMKNDETFKHRKQFTTLESMSWKDCVPLQAADLLAYENFKAIERGGAGHKRRKTLELLLDLRSFGGLGTKLTRVGIREIIQKHDEKSKKILFANARIRLK